MATGNKKILVIGGDQVPNTYSINWGEEIYVGDYDVLIVNTVSLTREVLKSLRFSYFTRLRDNIFDVQKNANLEVYCILSRLVFALERSGFRESAEEEVTSALNNYSWCPIIPLMEVIPNAKNLDKTNAKINKDYLTKITSYRLIHLYSVNNTGYKSNTQLDIRINQQNLLLSNVKRIVGFENIWSAYQGPESWAGLISKGSPTYFLPPTDIETEGIAILVSEILGEPNEPAPEWVSGVQIEGESLIVKEINSKQQEIENINSSIASLNKDLQNLNDYKKLLYATGDELEEIAEKTLLDLGVEVKKPEVSNIEDRHFLDSKGKKIFFEIRGVNRLMNENDLTQLVKRVVDQPVSDEYKTRGIFIFNHKNKSPIEEREDAFHYNIEKQALVYDLCLIDTLILYSIINKKILGEDISSFKDKLFNTVGVFRDTTLMLDETSSETKTAV